MLDKSKDVYNTFPFQMKRRSKWVITSGETLKVNKHTIVTTKQSFEEEGIEETDILIFNHIFLEEGEKKPQTKVVKIE